MSKLTQQWKLIQRAANKPFECIPVRVTVGLISMLGFINMYMTRVNLSIIIVAMVKTNFSREEYCVENEKEPVCQRNATDPFLIIGDLDWSEATCGLVLSFFFYGYVITQVPGGRIAEVLGTKRVFGSAILFAGILTLLSPATAKWHPASFCALRFIMGLLQGVTWPAMNALTVRWIPQGERTRFMTIVYIAATFGVVLTMPLCGYVISVAGWEAAFYVTGVLSVVWAMFWWLLIFDNPEDHPRIKRSELEYITCGVRCTGTSATRMRKVPWRTMFRCLPFWAIIIADIGSGFGFTMIITQYPRFLYSVFKFSTTKSGFISATPFLVRYIGATVFGWISDHLIASDKMSVVAVRRLFSIIGMFLPAATLAVLIELIDQLNLVIALVALCMFFNSGYTASVFVNCTDIAPNYAGTMYGIVNSLGSLFGSFAPMLAGFITTESTISQWRNVFIILIPLYVGTEILYLCLASGSVQAWNYKYSEGEESNGCKSKLVALPVVSDCKRDQDNDSE